MAHGDPSIEATVLDTIREELKARGSVNFWVSGFCMEPAIRDDVMVQVVEPGTSYPGDILAYVDAESGQRFMHRFVGKVPAGGTWKYLLMADNASKPDTLVARQQVLGKVVRVDGMRSGVSLGCRARSMFRYAWGIGHILLHRNS